MFFNNISVIESLIPAFFSLILMDLQCNHIHLEKLQNIFLVRWETKKNASHFKYDNKILLRLFCC